MVNIKKTLDEGIENLEKGLSQGIKQQVSATARAVAGQAGAGQSSGQGQSDQQGTSEDASHAAQQSTPQSDQATKDEVAAFYAPSNSNEQHGLSPFDSLPPEAGRQGKKEPSGFFKKQIKEGKTPEEAAKLEALRKKLHDEEYYTPLTQRKPAEEEQKEEEQVKEEEKMEELKVEDKKKKQDDDIAIKQAQQKTEKFPGASG